MKSKELSRREFVRLTSMGLAGGCALLSGGEALARMGTSGMGGMGGMGGGGMGGGGIIDPPVSAEFADPWLAPNLTPGEPGVVTVQLAARSEALSLNGRAANLMVYRARSSTAANSSWVGGYPGPTIRVNPGDTLRVRLTNELYRPSLAQDNLLGCPRNLTNLHTHGWHVSPNGPMLDEVSAENPGSDFVMYDLPPGRTYYHEYDTSNQPGGTLSFYHPHRHEVVAEQVWAGLAGALIVEDEPAADAVLKGYEEHVLVLKDLSLSGADPAPHATMMDFMQGKEGDLVTVSGQVNPYLKIKRNQVQRWRILNASNARFYRLSLDSHDLNLIGTDGGLLDRPYACKELLLSPGERVDVLVRGGAKPGDYRLRALSYARMGMMSSATVTLMTLRYSGQQSPAQYLPSPSTKINPAANRLTPASVEIAGEKTFVLTMGSGKGYINGISYEPPNVFETTSDVGTYEIWNVVNQSGMDHPFHQHVNAAQVLSISGGDPNYASLYTAIPAWKDTVLVPRMGSVKLLVPIMDYTGMAMFHCHILEHEDIGMLGVWTIGGMPPM